MPRLAKPATAPDPTDALAVPESRASTLSLWIGTFIIISVGRATEIIPGGTAIPLGKIVFLIAAIIAFQNREALTKVRLRDIPGAFAAFFVFGLAVITVPISIYRGASLSHLDGIIVQALAFWLIVRSAASVHDVRRILRCLIVAGALLTMTTLIGYQGGRASLTSSYDTNDLAYVLVTIFPIALAFALAARGWKRLAWLGLTLAMLATVLLTQSRGGVIALLAMLLVGAALPLVPRKNGKKVGVAGLMARLAGLALLGVVAWFFLPDATKERLATITSLGSDYNTDLTNNESRLTIWKRAAEASLERPIGYGLYTFNMVDGMRGGQYRTAHNSLLQITVELGVLALIFYLRAYVKTWGLLKKVDTLEASQTPPGQPDSKSLARALRWALVGNFCAAFFLSQAYSNTLWTLIAVSSALVVAMHVVEPPKPAKRRIAK